jgi:hypothetical protein
LWWRLGFIFRNPLLLLGFGFAGFCHNNSVEGSGLKV